MNFIEKKIKSTFDKVISVVMAIILMPIVLVLSILNLIFLGWPVFFVQKRIGQNEREFELIKFRTMTNSEDPDGKLLPDAVRLTSYGKFLRKCSFDEIPSLINVIKGEMSLVGPRPLLPEYLPYYTKEQRKRHHVKPGITGLVQVSGRNSLSWEDKFDLDIKYVDNQSLLLDFKIIFSTIKIVLKGDDVTHDGHPTMPRFDDRKNT